MVERLRTITEGLGWKFFYGRRDFQNLVEANEENDPDWYFFLDPLEEDYKIKNEPVFTGRAMVVSKSDLDEVYDSQKENIVSSGKWQKYILPKKQYFQKDFREILDCTGVLEIENYKLVDVINLYDENWDGVILNFTIREYL